MNYSSRNNYDHNEAPRVGVLITNLGTPDAPTPSALRRYLAEFLSDPRVVEVNRLLWWFILKVILIIRPARSAKSYEKIWTTAGSPLAVNTQAQAEALQKHLGDRFVVDWAMRYGQPSISSKIESLINQGVRKLLVLPLYPQYSGSTTASTFDAISADFTQRRWLPALRFIETYHNHPAYIEALCASIRQHWEAHGRADKLVFTYHGVPLRFLHKGDPYHCFCHTTSRLIAEKLGLNENEHVTTFQSRFGREQWLQPYTDYSLKAMPEQGIKTVQLICPGFSSDCLETLEEIAIENRDYFLEAGGDDFQYIPALNSRSEHIECLSAIVKENLHGWLEETGETALTAQRAKQHPHNQVQ